jgi:tetratricopeptide (TPR) repeat protein
VPSETLSVTEILYRSPALEVRRVAAGDGRRQVVTFDSYHEPHGLDRPGFGEAFFLSEGVTAIHVLSHANDWFQTSEIRDIIQIIRTESAAAERLLAYGSSMGGYGALRFAGAIGAHAALALSPQYSLDPRKVPFETRWSADQRRIRFREEIDGTIVAGPRMILAYDPGIEADRRHAELVAAAIPAELLPFPRAGHPVGGFLNDVKLLRRLVFDALDGSLDTAAFLREAHGKRSGSAHWLANLAEAQPAWRPRCAIVLARRAVAAAPDHPSLLDVLARRLAAAGDYAQAIDVHRQVIASEPIADYQWSLSKTLHASGDTAGALEVAGQLQRLAPDVPGYHAWASRLREEQGELAGAAMDMRAALRRDPRNRGYRWQYWRLILARLRHAVLRG